MVIAKRRCKQAIQFGILSTHPQLFPFKETLGKKLFTLSGSRFLYHQAKDELELCCFLDTNRRYPPFQRFLSKFRVDF